MRAIPIKYVEGVDVFLSSGVNYSIDVKHKIDHEWKCTFDEASSLLETIIEEIHKKEGIKLIEYILDFNMIRSEISFTSARLGNENDSNSNLH